MTSKNPHTTTHTTDVLIVGAGPAGLATAIAVATHGARALVVERHRSTSIHPRASGLSTRTMEIFREWGVAHAVRGESARVAIEYGAGETLADPGMTANPSGFPGPREALAVSPSYPACSPQDRVEPILVDAARRHGADVRFGAEVTALTTGPRGVRAELTDAATGSTRSVHARWVVGADGPRSTVRRAVGIPSERLGHLGGATQLLFRADLDGVLGSRRFVLYSLSHPEARGLIIPFGPDRWGYARPTFDGTTPEMPAPGRWLDLLRLATGVPDLQPEVLGATVFELAADLATTFHAGRAFLVGDAAHRMTPIGGRGMNTAVHDGHTLGWKLAWAARGWAGAALLASHTDERRPVGALNARRSLDTDGRDPSDGLLGDVGVRYESTVIDGGIGNPHADPDGTPGGRAPHVWVTAHGRRRSTLDLFAGRMTLLVGPEGRGWEGAANACTGGPPVTALVAGVDVDDPGGRLTDAYRLAPDGAVLVRPDGYVAWRAEAAAADPVGVLDRAVGTALGRDPAVAQRRAG
jgi:2-polyprenyl-6-methoxyphenol hydroxylase-like FAD-dependent oxidoreductase